MHKRLRLDRKHAALPLNIELFVRLMIDNISDARRRIVHGIVSGEDVRSIDSAPDAVIECGIVVPRYRLMSLTAFCNMYIRCLK